jgi:hypothetical protein
MEEEETERGPLSCLVANMTKFNVSRNQPEPTGGSMVAVHFGLFKLQKTTHSDPK